MFKNVGEKIKCIAIICTIIEFLASWIIAIYCWVSDMVFFGFVALLFGGIYSIVGAFLLYGFGVLITAVTNIEKEKLQMLADKSTEGFVDQKEKIQNKVLEEYEIDESGYFDEDENVNIAENDECPCCFHKIKNDETECSYCGYKLK